MNSPLRSNLVMVGNSFLETLIFYKGPTRSILDGMVVTLSSLSDVSLSFTLYNRISGSSPGLLSLGGVFPVKSLYFLALVIFWFFTILIHVIHWSSKQY